jgi:hypothetical protein
MSDEPGLAAAADTSADQPRHKESVQDYACTAKAKYRKLKQIFPEKEYRVLSPNFHIHAPVRDLYISTIGLPILLEEVCRPILGLNRSLTDT